MPLTMTAEREAEHRKYAFMTPESKELLAELDAERAAHQETQANYRELEVELAETQAITRELAEALGDAFSFLEAEDPWIAHDEILPERDTKLSRARAILAKAKGVLPAVPDVQFDSIHPPSRRQD